MQVLKGKNFMKTVKTPSIRFTYDDLPNNEQQVQFMYNRILAIAKQNILTGTLIKLTEKITISAKARIVNNSH